MFIAFANVYKLKLQILLRIIARSVAQITGKTARHFSRHYKSLSCSTEHRFAHPCRADDDANATTAKEGQQPTTKPQKFLCSFKGCFNEENMKLDCSKCERNYCMRHVFIYLLYLNALLSFFSHRQCELHECDQLKARSGSSKNAASSEAPSGSVTRKIQAPKKVKNKSRKLQVLLP